MEFLGEHFLEHLFLWDDEELAKDEGEKGSEKEGPGRTHDKSRGQEENKVSKIDRMAGEPKGT